MVKFCTSLLLLVPCLLVFGQKKREKDSTAIISYADKFVVKINVDTQTDTYTLRNNIDGTNLSITPNNNYRLFLSLDYQFLGLSIGFSPTFFSGNNDDDLKGESSFSDFRFRAALGQWVQGFQISSIKGYYVENTGDFIPDWVEGVDPYIQISNLTSRIYGMSTSYVFNPNFSFRNVIYNTEWQKKSTGSFIPTLFYSYDPFSYELEDFKSKENVFPIRLSLAYYYTVVIHDNWFIAANLSPSLGVRFSKLKLTINDISTQENNTYFTTGLEGGLQIGYASRKIVFGTGFTFDVYWNDEDRLGAVENDKIYGLIYFGYRFNTPGFIDRAYNKFAKKIGI
ncbi:MAG: DUF4421 family protein [Flavobacteriaceae bacterium]